MVNVTRNLSGCMIVKTGELLLPTNSFSSRNTRVTTPSNGLRIVRRSIIEAMRSASSASVGVLFERGQDVGFGHGELACHAGHFLLVGVPFLAQLLQFGETPPAEIAFGHGGVQPAVRRRVGFGDLQGDLLSLAVEGSEQLVLLHAISFMDREAGDDSRFRRDQVQLPNGLGETFEVLILHVVSGFGLAQRLPPGTPPGQPARVLHVS